MFAAVCTPAKPSPQNVGASTNNNPCRSADFWQRKRMTRRGSKKTLLHVVKQLYDEATAYEQLRRERHSNNKPADWRSARMTNSNVREERILEHFQQQSDDEDRKCATQKNVCGMADAKRRFATKVVAVATDRTRHAAANADAAKVADTTTRWLIKSIRGEIATNASDLLLAPEHDEAVAMECCDDDEYRCINDEPDEAQQNGVSDQHFIIVHDLVQAPAPHRARTRLNKLWTSSRQNAHTTNKMIARANGE